MRVLAVVAHSDDETIGAGGTLARWAAEGAACTVLVLTRCADGGRSYGEAESDP